MTSKPPPTVDPTDFRNAMSQFASGVTVVTTDGPGGPAGFTASAFSSLSLNPPLVLVCLDRSADCFDAFMAGSSMAISILAAGQSATAMRFATRGADKFGEGTYDTGKATGLPLVDRALAQVECRMHQRLDGGDHVILVGEVLTARISDRKPLLHYNRQFGEFLAE